MEGLIQGPGGAAAAPEAAATATQSSAADDPVQRHSSSMISTTTTTTTKAAAAAPLQVLGQRNKLDADVATLSLKIDEHMHALTQDAVGHLLGVKARMLASLEGAVADEHEAGRAQLATQQAEMEALAAELKHTKGLLDESGTFNDRLSSGYAAKQQAARDKLNLLRGWYVWRERAQRQRRLQHLALRLQHWYVHRWLLGRAWDRWLGQARLQYRTLVAERAEKQRQADAASLQAVHAQEVALLRAQLEAKQQQLQLEAQARNKMEEEMKRAFMRGVTAINLEALQVMRRGAPPSSANPFPVAVPLNAATAAAGLTAAAAAAAPAGQPAAALQHELSGQHAAWQGASQLGQQAPAGPAGHAAAEYGSGAGGHEALASTLQDWLSPSQLQQQQQAAGAAAPYQGLEGSCGGGSNGASAFAAAAQYWSSSDGGGSSGAAGAAAPAPESPMRHPALGARAAAPAYGYVDASPSATQEQQQQQQQQQVVTDWVGFSGRSPGGIACVGGGAGSPAAGLVPRVYVERGPAAVAGAAGAGAGTAAATSPVKAAGPARTTGARRALQAGAGRMAGCSSSTSGGGGGGGGKSGHGGRS